MLIIAWQILEHESEESRENKLKWIGVGKKRKNKQLIGIGILTKVL